MEESQQTFSTIKLKVNRIKDSLSFDRGIFQKAYSKFWVELSENLQAFDGRQERQCRNHEVCAHSRGHSLQGIPLYVVQMLFH